VILVF